MRLHNCINTQTVLSCVTASSIMTKNRVAGLWRGLLMRGMLDNNESLLKPLYYIKDEVFLGQVCDLPKSHNVKVIGL